NSSGFFLAGILFLIAPDLIQELLGDKWLPMVLPFQLMLIYTLFNPVKSSIGGLFVAVGRPETIVRARAIQLGIMLLGLFTLGFRYGIVGVAIAVDLMLILGLFLQLLLARDHVDYSWKDMFLNPFLCLIGGLVLYLVTSGWYHPANSWGAIIYSSLAFSLGYIGLYLLLEYHRLTGVYLPLVLDAIRGGDQQDQ
ncbi:MAG: polysaccharide biosynthesis C-terminal domain-containing protein, partial [Anaerolineales bacterium]